MISKNWNTNSNGNGISYNAGGSYTANSSVTLYAQWSPKQYTITFQANGGTTPTVSKNVAYASTYGTLPTPIRNGYEFLGWYTAATGGNIVSESTKVTITSNQTLYAQWEALPPYTDSSVNKSGTSYQIQTNTYHLPEDCTVMVAGYNENKLVSLAPSINGTATLSGDIDTVKVMAWESLSGLTSLCEAEVIPESEFIVTQ